MEKFISKDLTAPQKPEPRPQLSPFLHPALAFPFGTRWAAGHPLSFKPSLCSPGPRTTIRVWATWQRSAQGYNHLGAGLRGAQGLQTKLCLLNSVIFHFSHWCSLKHISVKEIFHWNLQGNRASNALMKYFSLKPFLHSEPACWAEGSCVTTPEKPSFQDKPISWSSQEAKLKAQPGQQHPTDSSPLAMARCLGTAAGSSLQILPPPPHYSSGKSCFRSDSRSLPEPEDEVPSLLRTPFQAPQNKLPAYHGSLQAKTFWPMESVCSSSL